MYQAISTLTDRKGDFMGHNLTTLEYVKILYKDRLYNYHKGWTIKHCAGDGFNLLIFPELRSSPLQFFPLLSKPSNKNLGSI